MSILEGEARFLDAAGSRSPHPDCLRQAEIIHIGQVVLTMGASIEYFRDVVFNYPTLAEAYKVAALDELNKL